MERNVWEWRDNPFSVDECIHTTTAFMSGRITAHGLSVDCKELKGKIDRELFLIMSGWCLTLCIPKSELKDGLRLTQLLADVGLTTSNGESAQKLKEGSIKINTAQTKDIKKIIGLDDLFEGKWLLLQKGKASMAIIMFWNDEG